MPRFPSRQMPRSTYEAEVDAAIRRDRARRELCERLGEPDPHVVVLADGCRTWLTYRYRVWAERGLAAARARGRRPDLWDDAELVPYRRERDGVKLTDYHAETGERLRPWHECPQHNDRNRGEQP